LDWNAIAQLVRDRVTVLGMEILGALVLYVIGRWLISLVVNAVQRALVKQRIEPTVMRFTGNWQVYFDQTWRFAKCWAMRLFRGPRIQWRWRR
jgi:hypothetical protein